MNGTASVHLRFCEGALLAAIAGTAFPWDAEVAPWWTCYYRLIDIMDYFSGMY